MTDTVSKRARREGEWLQQLSPKGNRLEQQAGGGGGRTACKRVGEGMREREDMLRGGEFSSHPQNAGRDKGNEGM